MTGFECEVGGELAFFIFQILLECASLCFEGLEGVELTAFGF